MLRPKAPYTSEQTLLCKETSPSECGSTGGSWTESRVSRLQSGEEKFLPGGVSRAPSCLGPYLLLKLVDLFVVICQLCRGGKSKHSIKSATDTRCTEVNIHTAGKSVFMIMLMDRCYLLQQHLHLLTARSGGQEVRGQASQSQDVSSDLNLGTFCHWPAPPPAWPALSAGPPAGSETPGCRRHKSASACGPEEMETG